MKRLLLTFALAVATSLGLVSPAQGEALPESAYVKGLIGHAQTYTLSCESRSASDFAAFWGLAVTETEFLQALPRSDNPDHGFVGDPNGAWGQIPPRSYGVHADPVAETLQQFGLNADAHSNLAWAEAQREIASGRPVIVWVIAGVWAGTPVAYQAADGSVVTVAANEHTMILTGYSPTTVELLDAATGRYGTYGLDAFLRSWAVLGNMAVFGPPLDTNDKQTADQAPAAPELQVGAYTVQKGDYLIALSRRFDVSWLDLAQLNSLSFPYFIQPGQVLQLPSAALAEPDQDSPTEKVIAFQSRLPLVQRNFAASAAPQSVVVVERLQTLLSFARQAGLDWHQLAKLNHLRLPYIVYPGQVLRFK